MTLPYRECEDCKIVMPLMQQHYEALTYGGRNSVAKLKNNSG